MKYRFATMAELHYFNSMKLLLQNFIKKISHFNVRYFFVFALLFSFQSNFSFAFSCEQENGAPIAGQNISYQVMPTSCPSHIDQGAMTADCCMVSCVITPLPATSPLIITQHHGALHAFNAPVYSGLIASPQAPPPRFLFA